MAALDEAGVDLLAIETQTDLSEMEQALAAAHEVAPNLAVLVTASFTQDDRTFLGSTPERVAARLAELGADAVGVNCGQGPAQALRVVRAMRSAAGDLPLVVRPNAGGPQQVGGRFLYPATPEYFAATARALLADGVAVIGGCCGTGPDHTWAMASVIAGGAAAGPAIEVLEQETAAVEAAATSGAPVASSSQLATKLADKAFVVGVEMEPPRGHDAAHLIAAAETLAEAGADVINVADSPMARMRMSPWAACRLVQEHAGIETVLHFPTRGRSVVRIQGDLLAAYALGIRNLFVCMGDPLTIGDYPHGVDVVDLTASGLIALVTGSLNRGTDQAGASIGDPTSYLVGCAVSPSAPDIEHESRLLHRKVEAGAAFALTQPLFSAEPLRGLRAAYERVAGVPLELPLLVGVLPLSSSRHADFIHNEVPGVFLPETVLERMRAAGEDGRAEGLRMAVEVGTELRSSGSAGGMYVMPQFGRFDVAAEIVEAVART
jgi:homocysteine S-methyltransferase